MEAENVFTLVSTFMVLQTSLRALPLVISYLIQAFIAIKRIEGYLEEPEINVPEVGFMVENEVEEKPLEEKVLNNLNQSRKEEWSIKVKGNFFWDLEEKDKNEEAGNKKNKKKTVKEDLEKGLLSEEKNEEEPRMFKALNNLNLKVKKGEFNAIVGE